MSLSIDVKPEPVRSTDCAADFCRLTSAERFAGPSSVMPRTMFVELGRELTVPAGNPAPGPSSVAGALYGTVEVTVVESTVAGVNEVVGRLVTPSVVLDVMDSSLLVKEKLVMALDVLEPVVSTLEPLLSADVESSPALEDVELVISLLVVTLNAVLDDGEVGWLEDDRSVIEVDAPVGSLAVEEDGDWGSFSLVVADVKGVDDEAGRIVVEPRSCDVGSDVLKVPSVPPWLCRLPGEVNVRELEKFCVLAVFRDVDLLTPIAETVKDVPWRVELDVGNVLVVLVSGASDVGTLTFDWDIDVARLLVFS